MWQSDAEHLHPEVSSVRYAMARDQIRDPIRVYL